jgi:hypothetical protein
MKYESRKRLCCSQRFQYHTIHDANRMIRYESDYRRCVPRSSIACLANRQNHCATEVRCVYRIVSNDTRIRDEPIGDRLSVALHKVVNAVALCHLVSLRLQIFLSHKTDKHQSKILNFTSVSPPRALFAHAFYHLRHQVSFFILICYFHFVL